MRFLSDTSLSGGSWLWACPTPSTAPTHVPRSSTSTPAAPAPGLSVGPFQDLDSSSSGQQAGASGPGSGSGGGGGGVQFELVPHGSSSRRSSCDIEVVCSWRCLHSLTPDATQLAQQDWQPPVSCLALLGSVSRPARAKGHRVGVLLTVSGCCLQQSVVAADNSQWLLLTAVSQEFTWPTVWVVWCQVGTSARRNSRCAWQLD